MFNRTLILLISILFLSPIITLTPIPAHTNPATNPTTSFPPEDSIAYPRCSDPVFVTPGGSFTLTLNLTDFNYTDPQVSIATAYEPVTDTFSLDIQNHTAAVYNVTIPPTVPIELYNLTVSLIHNGAPETITQPRAVDVIPEFKDNYTFIHITDIHVGDPRSLTQSIYRSLHHRSLLQAIEEINLQHPDFVLISGDLVHGQLYYHQYSHEYPELYDLLQHFDVPTFLCPGNHDGYSKPGEDGKAFWTHYFGPDYYSFNYGPYHFQMLDTYDFPKAERTCISFASLNWGGSIQDPQLHWIEQDLNQSRNSTLTFMVVHHNPQLETTKESLVHTPYKNRQQLLSLIHHYNVSMILAGHTHWDNLTIENGTIFATTTTLTSSVDEKDCYWGYRIVHIQNGTIASYNYKEPKYSVPLYKLRLTTLTPTAVIIKNKQQNPLSLLLRFVTPRGNYTPTYGDIIQTRTNGTMQELYVHLTLDALQSHLVRLKKTS